MSAATVISHVAVVVPAADEQDRIAACLDAISRALGRLVHDRPDLSVEIGVVLDGCGDHTEDIVGDFAGVRVIGIASRCVGIARDVGTRVALNRAPAPPDRVLTLHTDADSTVPTNWFTGHLQHAEAGADLVLGSVEPDLDVVTLDRWRIRHRTDDGHPNVHGANLGIRGDLLLRIGGWPHLPTGEDVHLVRRAEAAGGTIVRAGGLTVTTSARHRARAPLGFADYLQEWSDSAPGPPLAVG